ncbi:MAG: hypothetical protein EBS97_03975 [Verrucomicrobia bacterium]|nr:hypothetical protein [Verrucomicrobiota bacterium]
MALSIEESQVLQALQQYLTAVSAQKKPNPPDLIPHCLRLEQLEAEHASRISPRLHHFLESKSYRKAHDFLTTQSTSPLANAKDSAHSCSR